jgi:hypothetical protein
MARPLQIIANEVWADWKNVNYAAAPYLDAMATMQSVQDDYGFDSGKSIVIYFLSNATTWRGETARRVKKELKALIK